MMASLTLEYHRRAGWPSLAWLAECDVTDTVVRISHGPGVETRAEWFCEAVWEGVFDSDDFDRTDLVFGSGGRVREGQVIFVSSGSTVDRLQSLTWGNSVLVSNSLACLMSASATKVNPGFGRYPEFFRSIVNGIDAYERILPTQAGIVELCYFRNLVWNGRQLSVQDKMAMDRDFGSFEKYWAFLSGALGRISANARALGRKRQYEFISALSSGYDSSAAAVLGRSVGMRRAFSFASARGGAEDHGQAVADSLGLDLTVVERNAWRKRPLAELPYFAATGLGADVVFSSAADLLRGCVVLTGFHGDKLWGKDTKALSASIVRGDASGLSFTEHRLELGCIHLPVPFMGVRQIGDIHRLSNSAELSAWDVPGDYSRPVARRMIEQAGVRRGTFGVSKKAATNLFRQGEALLSEETRAEFDRWLVHARQRGEIGRLATGLLPIGMLLALRRHSHYISRLIRLISAVLPAARLAGADTKLQRWLNRKINRVEYLFPWAIERQAERYRETR